MLAMATTILLRLRYLRRHVLGVAWRGMILAAVFFCALSAMWLGVEFSERPGGTDDSLRRLYYTLGLFVLGGLDLGTPTGGPWIARVMMWFAYFAAPVLTVASVVEGVLRTISPKHWRLRRLRNHVIVVGCGRTGRLYLERLRKEQPRKPVVMVDTQPDHPAEAEITNVHRALFVPGDIRERRFFETLGLEHADRVLLMTGDSYANLDAAAEILTRKPSLARRTVVRVSNLRLLNIVADTRLARECTIFNRHYVAASELVRTELLPHFQRTEGYDIVVLAGFGRFGQTVLDLLQREAAGTFDRVVIIDTDAERSCAVFGQQVGFADCYTYQVIEGDLRDPRVWQKAEGVSGTEPVFILGSGDDGANLSTALWVNSQFPSAYVVARAFYRSSFADEVSREGGFLVFSMADLITRSMPREWFGQQFAHKGRSTSAVSSPPVEGGMFDSSGVFHSGVFDGEVLEDSLLGDLSTKPGEPDENLEKTT